jgi:hypothetical protein
MRRIIVVLALTCSFAIGVLAGFSNNEATAATVCNFAPCYQNEWGVYTRWVCCRDTTSGLVACKETSTGCRQGDPVLF